MTQILHFPVIQVEDLERLDANELTAGYLLGLKNDSVLPDTASRAFWHGFQNGKTDSGGQDPSPTLAALARAYVASRGNRHV